MAGGALLVLLFRAYGVSGWGRCLAIAVIGMLATWWLFGTAFGVGLLITLISCVFYVVTWEVIYFNFMPDFMDKWEIGRASCRERV